MHYIPFGNKFNELLYYAKRFWKKLKLWALGGVFENFKNPSNSFIFSSFQQTNTSFKRSWGEEQDFGVIKIQTSRIFEKTEFFYRNEKMTPESCSYLQTLSNDVFFLFKKFENEGIRRIFEIFENSS